MAFTYREEGFQLTPLKASPPPSLDTNFMLKPSFLMAWNDTPDDSGQPPLRAHDHD